MSRRPRVGTSILFNGHDLLNQFIWNPFRILRMLLGDTIFYKSNGKVVTHFVNSYHND